MELIKKEEKYVEYTFMYFFLVCDTSVCMDQYIYIYIDR